jgi:hypothetical protein
VQDTIDRISRQNSKLLDGKVLEIVKRVKSVAVVKTSLEKLVDEIERKVPEKLDGGLENSAAAAAKATPKAAEMPKASVASYKASSSSAASKYAATATEFLEMMKKHPERVSIINRPFLP